MDANARSLSGGAGLSQFRPDVVIHSEEVAWIVFLLDAGKSREIGAESSVDDLPGLNIERGMESTAVDDADLTRSLLKKASFQGSRDHQTAATELQALQPEDE
jgi:hypothetical protein